jgi:hypothetical protein
VPRLPSTTIAAVPKAAVDRQLLLIAPIYQKVLI